MTTTIRVPLNVHTIDMVKPDHCVRNRLDLFKKSMPAERCRGCEFEILSEGKCEYEEVEIESASGDYETVDLDGDRNTNHWFHICCTNCNAIIEERGFGYPTSREVMKCKRCGTPHVFLRRVRNSREERGKYVFAVPTKSSVFRR